MKMKNQLPQLAKSISNLALTLPKKCYIKGDELPAHEPVGSKD
jgi:hypothetical protein